MRNIIIVVAALALSSCANSAYEGALAIDRKCPTQVYGADHYWYSGRANPYDPRYGEHFLRDLACLLGIR